MYARNILPYNAAVLWMEFKTGPSAGKMCWRKWSDKIFAFPPLSSWWCCLFDSLLRRLLGSCSKFSTQPPVRKFLDLSGFQGRGGIHIKTQVWKKTLLWSLWIYIWVLKKCSPVQWCYSFIHAFSIFTRGYWEADVLAQTKQDRETHSHSHLWAIFSLQFTWHVFLRMRGNWSTWRKPAHGSARKALKRIWIWPLLSVTDLRKPEARITVSSTPPVH